MAEGASVLLVTPGERQQYRTLLRALKRDTPLPVQPARYCPTLHPPTCTSKVRFLSRMAFYDMVRCPLRV
jgi:hypothetical protein